mgnify:CR=1 FL=1
MANKNPVRIYSRKRFVIGNGMDSNKNIEKNKVKKIIKILILIIVIILIVNYVFRYFEPIFATVCKDKIKSVATMITNQQSTLIMNKYQYEQLYTVEKGDAGNVMIVKANVVPINNLISDLTENIQNEFENMSRVNIKIPMGSLSRIYFLAGAGPKISLNVPIIGTVETNIKSEFVAQGINQTLHRVYVDFDCNMKLIAGFYDYTEKVVNQVIIVEHVIVGSVPESYYNLDGFDNEMDTMQIIK